MEKTIFKKCDNCELEKGLKENFVFNPEKRNGFFQWCKECQKKFLIIQYLELQNSTTEIGKEIKATHRTVLNFIERYNIPTRSISEAKKVKTSPILMRKDQMFDLYINQKLCVREIAEIIGNITGGCVLWWLKKHKIPIRPGIDALKPYQTSENNPMKGKFGELNHFFGKSHTDKTKEIISEKNRGKLIGDKNPAWKGGLSSVKDLIRKSNEYLKWRDLVFNKDSYKCIECGYDKGGILEADHIKPFGLILEENKIQSLEEAYLCQELWNVNNGRTLCKDCHKKTDTYGHKTTILIEEYKKNNEK